MPPSDISREVRLGSNALSQTMYVWNGGTGTLNFALSTDVPWLSVSPASGSSTGGENATGTGRQTAIQVNFDTAALALGSYTGLITIASADATNSPQTVRVMLKVAAARTFGAGDAPRITRIDRVDQQLTRIEWLSTPNQTYTLLRAYTLGEGFKVVAGGLAATPPLNVYYDNDSGGALFYRVAVEQK